MKNINFGNLFLEKILNEEMIELDKRLLKNFYLNKGYYKVKINTSFAKLFDGSNFELIYNIEANQKVLFNNLSLYLPDDFNKNNFVSLVTLFDELEGENYSLRSVEKILDQIDLITLNDEYKSISLL